MSDEKTKKVKAPKGTRRRWDFPIGLKKMDRGEADREVKRFFDYLDEEYRDVPPEELKKGARKIEAYLKGEIGWAELLNFGPEIMYQLAEHGYNQFQFGRYADAERIFKVLTVLDWNNSYYHSMMGSILQREKRYGEAVAEFSQAIQLYGDDVVSLTHRGEIYLQHGLLEEAKADLARAAKLDAKGEDKWANRARMLLVQIEKQRKQG